MDLQHKVAWVVGASTGIGAALARELQARGAKVAISARSSTQLDEVSGGAMLAVTADIRDAAALDAAHQRVSAELGAPDIVVIAAADSIPMGIDDWDRAGFAAVVDITLTGASNTIGAVLPTMLSRGSGTILGFVAPAGYRSRIAFPGRIAEPFRLVRLAPRSLWPALARRLTRPQD
ncbi:SDR family NAD(P)-dependent oxidoreductase [Dermacoccaceae bacterium W4C1]